VTCKTRKTWLSSLISTYRKIKVMIFKESEFFVVNLAEVELQFRERHFARPIPCINAIYTFAFGKQGPDQTYKQFCRLDISLIFWKPILGNSESKVRLI
ncbi:MAG TPA: hypothetical protein VN843_29810, partial [Anaerolineales bacterium]|nr:hypothetical protein [Anaerolineales bacterium]